MGEQMKKLPKNLSYLSWLILLIVSVYQLRLQMYWNATSLLGQISDDAYISLVYARNFASGLGIIYNPGQRVEGYTNFLWTMLMSLPFFLNIDPIFFVKILGAASSVTLIFGIYKVASRLYGRPVALIAAISIGISNHVAYMSTWGLETVFFMTLYIYAILFYNSERPILSGFFFALSALTRMEATILYGVYVLHSCFSSKIHKAIRLILSFIPIFGTYFIWRWTYYGWPLPNTYYAKVGGGEGKISVILRGMTYISEQSFSLHLFLPLAVVITILCVSIILRHQIDLPCFSDPLIPLLASCMFYVSYIVLVGGDVFNERLLVQALPLVILSLLWIPAATRRRTPSDQPPVDLRRGAVALTICTALGISSPHFPVSTHLTGWITIGKWLASHYPTGTIIATDAAGAIKYYSQLPTIDILGLNDTHIAHRQIEGLGNGVPGHEKQDDVYVIDMNPTVVTTWIDPDGEAGRGFRHVYQFRTQYTLQYLLDTSGHQISTNRLLEVNDRIDRCRLEYLVARGKPHVFDWGIWIRHPADSMIELTSSDFKTQVREGKLGGCSDTFLVQSNNPTFRGYLLYGPYLTLPTGSFHAEVTGIASNCTNKGEKILSIDVFDGKRILILEDVTKRDLNSQGEFSKGIDFINANAISQENFEIRTFSQGLCAITIQNVRLSQKSN
jgi:hypothetical protein